MRNYCLPQNNFSSAGMHMCTTVDPRTKCAVLPSVIHNVPESFAAPRDELDRIISQRIKPRNPIDYLWMGPVGLFRHTMDFISTTGVFVYNGPGFLGVVAGPLINVTVTQADVTGMFLGYHVILTGQLRAASSNLITVSNSETSAIIDQSDTSRTAALTVGILSEQEFFLPMGHKQDYNQNGRPIVSRLAVADDVIVFSGFDVPADVRVTVFPITPETWSFDQYSRAIEVWAQVLVSRDDPNNA